MKYSLVPLDLSEANELVERWHRHHKKVQGHKFSIGAAVGEEVVGAIIVGRPVARMLDDGATLEVTRCVTNGAKDACSALYGSARRAAFALGFKRLITYTLPEEGGASLRGAGFKLLGQAGGGTWNRTGRPRVDKHPTQSKFCWEVRS